MIENKELILGDKTYILYKFDCWSGRKIMQLYPMSAIPKMGDYSLNEEMAKLIMAHVAVKIDGVPEPLRLTNVDLIKNHVRTWEDQYRLEWAMMDYNCSFLSQGGLSTFLEELVEKLPAWATKMLTIYAQRSSQTEKPLSTS